MGQELKLCSRCNQECDKSDSWCKGCRIAYGKAWRNANSNKIKMYETLNRNKLLLYKKKWRKEHKEQIRINNKTWEANNPDRVKIS